MTANQYPHCPHCRQPQAAPWVTVEPYDGKPYTCWACGLHAVFEAGALIATDEPGWRVVPVAGGVRRVVVHPRKRRVCRHCGAEAGTDPRAEPICYGLDETRWRHSFVDVGPDGMEVAQ